VILGVGDVKIVAVDRHALRTRESRFVKAAVHVTLNAGSDYILHGAGVVIGQTCIIGSHVRLYQGVTLGVKNFEYDENGLPKKGAPRHPIFEDNVIIYSNSSVLGRITIGRGSIIAANVRITRDVPPGSIVYPAAVRVKIVDPETGEAR
jgi:serine O-acetyltransferase